jgi:hypothetical protein
MIITLLTIVGKRIKLHLSVWQPAVLSTTPEHLGGACVVTMSYSADCVIAHAKGHAPPKSSGVFLLAPTGLHPLARACMGCVEQNTGVSITPDTAVRPFSEGPVNTFATAVRQSGHGRNRWLRLRWRRHQVRLFGRG